MGINSRTLPRSERKLSWPKQWLYFRSCCCSCSSFSDPCNLILKVCRCAARCLPQLPPVLTSPPQLFLTSSFTSASTSVLACCEISLARGHNKRFNIVKPKNARHNLTRKGYLYAVCGRAGSRRAALWSCLANGSFHLASDPCLCLCPVRATPLLPHCALTEY